MKAALVLLALVAVAAGQSVNFNGAERIPSQLSRSSESSKSRDSADSDEFRNSIRRGNRQMTCSTSASFTTNIDGTTTTARCTDSGSDPTVRCPGCCASVALAAGLSADRASGFPSNNGRSCVCCIRG